MGDLIAQNRKAQSRKIWYVFNLRLFLDVQFFVIFKQMANFLHPFHLIFFHLLLLSSIDGASEFEFGNDHFDCWWANSKLFPSFSIGLLLLDDGFDYPHSVLESYLLIFAWLFPILLEIGISTLRFGHEMKLISKLGYKNQFNVFNNKK